MVNSLKLIILVHYINFNNNTIICKIIMLHYTLEVVTTTCHVTHFIEGRLERVPSSTLGVLLSTGVLINTLIDIDCGNWCVN